MFWEIFWMSIGGYTLVGILSTATLTRDEYRRNKIKTPDTPDATLRVAAATQGWANAFFWPVYLTMHFSTKALDKEAKMSAIDERTQQILDEVRYPGSWDHQFNKAQKEAHEKKFLSGEGG